MKLSVSVPDELWEAAQRRVDDDSPSAVVRAALNHLVAASEASAEYSVRPELDDDLTTAIEAARQSVLADARTMFQDGYRQGVKLAGELGFRQLDYLAGVGVKQGAKSMADFDRDMAFRPGLYPEGSEALIDTNILVKYVGDYADFVGDRITWRPADPTMEGIDYALRDVWQRVNAPADAAEDVELEPASSVFEA